MSILLILCFLFSTGAMVGWALELFYRHYFAADNPEHKWVNPGFLVGPYLPLYGFGLCVLYLLTYLEGLIPFENVVINKICLFILMALCMTLVELIAGEIFVVKMKVKLWDYSERWGNYKGIICPLFSFFWAVLGAIYYFLIHPRILNALAWLSENLAFSFFIGMFYGVFIIDLCYSINIFSKIKKFAKEYDIVLKYEALRAHIRERRVERKEKNRFFFTFKSEQPLHEHLKEFMKDLQDNWEEDKRMLNSMTKKTAAGGDGAVDENDNKNNLNAEPKEPADTKE